MDEPSISNFKWVCIDFPNITLLTKITINGEVQVTYAYLSVGKNSLRLTVAAFYLVGSLKALIVATINSECAFDISGNNIRLPTTHFFLRAAVRTLFKSKKLRN